MEKRVNFQFSSMKLSNISPSAVLLWVAVLIRFGNIYLTWVQSLNGIKGSEVARYFSHHCVNCSFIYFSDWLIAQCFGESCTVQRLQEFLQTLDKSHFSEVSVANMRVLNQPVTHQQGVDTTATAMVNCSGFFHLNFGNKLKKHRSVFRNKMAWWGSDSSCSCCAQ